MKLLYATSIILPSPLANRIQILNMAREFTSLLGDLFILGIGENQGAPLASRNVAMGSWVRSYIMAWRYLCYIHKEKITHVYCREEKLLFFMVLYQQFLFRHTPVFCYEAHHLSYCKNWWYQYMLSRVDFIVTLTNAAKQKIGQMGISENRILVEADAVDADLFDINMKRNEAREVLGLPEKKSIVMYTGSVEGWKGVNVLYECAKLFDSGYLFVIVGGRGLEQFQSEHVILENFLMLGYRDHADIPKYLKSADVLVLPNSNMDEDSSISTSPMKLFEYMASGTPIVASDIASLREVLNENNAVLVKADDPDDLTAGIRKVLENSELAAMIAQVARADVSSRTWKSRAENIMRFISTQ